MSDFVQTVREDGIAILTLNRPQTRNAIADDASIQAIVTALAEISADTTLRAAILTGAGPAFCAGGSLQSLGQLAAGEPIVNEQRYRTGIQRIPRAFQQIDIPVIARSTAPPLVPDWTSPACATSALPRPALPLPRVSSSLAW
ncbi:enoyl-CoA hydratase (plasmid) [Cupriavidus necator N-1]|uniref:Enoyl-CoA hydratase n=1 Tax=Cupriavidus necator (strain ATCC 43291 / DSM 13513 / CCUG 52238 / LMG 8453 / N-1) TaxID=1042878 RepID=F8GVV3_CUPNN|nr:enoyl-CoA hydratase [Cupriavidus necator N-1]